MSLRVTLLGTGTSHGVPMIGCDCAVCRSSDPRDRRTRPSILLEVDSAPGGVRSVLVDTALARGEPNEDLLAVVVRQQRVLA